MDSMDWFDPGCDEASVQIIALNRALAPGGRVMLRSAGLRPWYVRTFSRNGFAIKRVGARLKGECIDRVNMYASTWICTKTAEVFTASQALPEENNLVEKLEL
jgi:betaine lipid synthase